MILQRPTGVWSQIFEDHLLAVVEAEAEAEAEAETEAEVEESICLSSDILGVSNHSLLYCNSISEDCDVILLSF
jgi:hypothetical protein